MPNGTFEAPSDLAGVASNYNERIIEEFRGNAGRVGGSFQGATLLLLTTKGARSGQPRTTPLMYMADGERFIVVGSAAGASKHPAWFHNLVARPQVRVEVGTDEFPVRAEVLEGEERQRLWDRLITQAPGFADYQRNTARQIPLIALTSEAD